MPAAWAGQGGGAGEVGLHRLAWQECVLAGYLTLTLCSNLHAPATHHTWCRTSCGVVEREGREACSLTTLQLFVAYSML